MVANCRGGAVRRAAPGLPSSARVSNRAVRFAEETMMRAFIFPGQGSQAVGMGGALADASPVARAVFEEVDEALGQNLFRLMREGPADDLTLTENAQPAIMANAIATDRKSPRLHSSPNAQLVRSLLLENKNHKQQN